MKEHQLKAFIESYRGFPISYREEISLNRLSRAKQSDGPEPSRIDGIIYNDKAVAVIWWSVTLPNLNIHEMLVHPFYKDENLEADLLAIAKNSFSEFDPALQLIHKIPASECEQNQLYKHGFEGVVVDGPRKGMFWSP